MATVSEIRGELSKARPEEWKAFIEKYETDSRTGVIKLVEGCKRQIKKAEIENERLENMLIYEKKYYMWSYNNCSNCLCVRILDYE